LCDLYNASVKFGENIEGCKLLFHLGPNFCQKMLANLKYCRRHWCLRQ